MTRKFKRYAVFVDESSQTKHRFLTLGCLVIDAACLSAFEERVTYARDLELRAGEMKWTKVSASKLNVYKLVADCFFDHPLATEDVHFHSLVVDTTKIRDDLYNEGDREIGFNKEIYQLLIKCSKLYPNAIFDVFADNRQTPFSMEELRNILNNGMKKRGDSRPVPFRSVQFCDSKKFNMLQLNDILLGATTFQINGHHLKPEASAHKCHMSSYILDRGGVKNPMRSTSIAGKFTIWHRKLR
jgi:hypothetical protein